MSTDHELRVEVQMDETDVNLRAYLEGLSAEHLAKYNTQWSDEEVVRVGWQFPLRRRTHDRLL